MDQVNARRAGDDRMNGTLESQVRRILADLLAISAEEITIESSPETIEAWDSLQHLSLVLAIEQEFGIRFKPEEIEELNSLKVVAEKVRAKIANHS
jgi:acyl carrier protein